MKICIVTHTFPKTPNDTTAAFMHPLVLGLTSMGNEVAVLTPYHIELKTSNFPYKIVTYKYIWPNFFHRLGYSQTLSEGTSFKLETYILAPFLYFFGFLALLRLLKREKFDIISSHWILPNGFISYLVTRFIRIPYTITLAGSDVYVANKNIFFSFMAKLAAQGAKIVFADSPTYVDQLKKTGAIVKNYSIVPYPVDTSVLKINPNGILALKKDLNLKKENIVLLAVGRLIYKKGFQYLLEAFSKVTKKYKEAVLIIIGEGDLGSELKKLAKILHIESFTKFVGNVKRDKIVTFYNLADIFIMPSVVDQNGNTDDRPVALLEAIACGKPVVATNFPGNALSIKEGESGFLVPQKNIKSLGYAISRLIESKELRISMSREASKIANKNFGIKTIGEKYNIAFKNLHE